MGRTPDHAGAARHMDGTAAITLTRKDADTEQGEIQRDDATTSRRRTSLGYLFNRGLRSRAGDEGRHCRRGEMGIRDPGQNDECGYRQSGVVKYERGWAVAVDGRAGLSVEDAAGVRTTGLHAVTDKRS